MTAAEGQLPGGAHEAKVFGQLTTPGSSVRARRTAVQLYAAFLAPATLYLIATVLSYSINLLDNTFLQSVAAEISSVFVLLALLALTIPAALSLVRLVSGPLKLRLHILIWWVAAFSISIGETHCFIPQPFTAIDAIAPIAFILTLVLPIIWLASTLAKGKRLARKTAMDAPPYGMDRPRR
jgi:hypothetical protein